MAQCQRMIANLRYAFFQLRTVRVCRCTFQCVRLPKSVAFKTIDGCSARANGNGPFADSPSAHIGNTAILSDGARSCEEIFLFIGDPKLFTTEFEGLEFCLELFSIHPLNAGFVDRDAIHFHSFDIKNFDIAGTFHFAATATE